MSIKAWIEIEMNKDSHIHKNEAQEITQTNEQI